MNYYSAGVVTHSNIELLQIYYLHLLTPAPPDSQGRTGDRRRKIGKNNLAAGALYRVLREAHPLDGIIEHLSRSLFVS